MQIIISIISVIFSDYYLKNIIKSYQDLAIKDEIWLETIKMYETSGEIIITSYAMFTVLLNIWILFYLFKRRDQINYRLIIGSSLIGFMINESILITIISIVNILVVFFVKRKKIVSKRKKKIENVQLDADLCLPKRLYRKKDKILAILSIIVYFFLPSLITFLPFGYLGKSIILDLLLIIVCFIIFYKELKQDFVCLKNNLKRYVRYIFNQQLLAFGVYFLVSMMVVLIKGPDNAVSVNQQVAESLPILYIIPTSLIYAPFVEELVFRGAFRRIIKNDKWFIILSGLSFGLLHTLSEATLFNVIIMSLPYSILGGFFAYLYVKTNNVTASMVGHFIHNGFACLMMLIA